MSICTCRWAVNILIFSLVIFTVDCFQLLRTFPPSSQLFSELRFLISGTKNAYTTLRPLDVIFYSLSAPINGRSKALGLYTADQLVLPLLNHENTDEFSVDEKSQPLSATTLKNEGRIIRIVSSDRFKGRFIVNEYLDDDVLIQTESPEVPTAPQNNGEHTTQEYSPTITLSSEVELIEAKLKVAKLELQLLELKAKQHAKDAATPSFFPLTGRPYSQGVAMGNLAFISGCLGVDPITSDIVKGGIEYETHQAMKNLLQGLEACGSSKSDICKITLILTDMAHYHAANAIYLSYLDASRLPARTCLAAAALPRGALVEVECVAAVRQAHAFVTGVGGKRGGTVTSELSGWWAVDDDAKHVDNNQK